MPEHKRDELHLRDAARLAGVSIHELLEMIDREEVGARFRVSDREIVVPVEDVQREDRRASPRG